MEQTTKKAKTAKADAYLKVAFIDNAGNKFHFKMDTFLYGDRPFDKALIDNPDILKNLKREQIEFTINVPKEAEAPVFGQPVKEEEKEEEK